MVESVLCVLPCLVAGYMLHAPRWNRSSLTLEAALLTVGSILAAILEHLPSSNTKLLNRHATFSTRRYGVTIGTTLVPLVATSTFLLADCLANHVCHDWLKENDASRYAVVAGVTGSLISVLAPFSPFSWWMLTCAPVLFIGAFVVLQRIMGQILTLEETYIIATMSSISLLDMLFISLSMMKVLSKKLLFTRSIVSVFHPALLWGMVLIGIVGYPILLQARLAQESQHNGVMHIVYSVGFAVSAIVVVGIIDPWIWLIIKTEPFTWTITYITDANTWRPYLIIYWMILVTGAVTIASTWSSTASSLSSHINFRRKYFHALALLLFAPGYLLEPQLMHLAFSVAISAFIMIEYMRIFHIGPIQPQTMDMFVHQFLNARDQLVQSKSSPKGETKKRREVVVSHLSLMFGCAVPVWLTQIVLVLENKPLLILGLTGILSLGVGDSAASIIGKAVGKTKWFRKDKTVEGTLGFVIGSLGALYAVQIWLDRFGDSVPKVGFFVRSAISVVLTGLLEAFSEQNDNLVVPLYMFALLSLGMVYL
ncbi:hypothetical protein BDV3_005054 [Batrachochytrium dendrobatidis]